MNRETNKETKNPRAGLPEQPPADSASSSAPNRTSSPQNSPPPLIELISRTEKFSPETLRISHMLSAGRDYLKTSSSTPDLDTLLLLAFSLNRSKEAVFRETEELIPPEKQEALFRLFEQRRRGIPLAYLRGQKEFYGFDFFVGPGVLCPRPETEILVEAVVEFLRSPASRKGSFPLKIHDIGTGSGCIILSVFKEIEAREPGLLEASASDLSPAVRPYFSRNNQELCGGRVSFSRGSLTEGLTGPFLVLTANLPYLTRDETDTALAQGWNEPESALYGGRQGLELIETLIARSPAVLAPKARLYLEAAPPQMPALRRLLHAGGFSGIRVLPDLAGRDRVIIGEYPG